MKKFENLKVGESVSFGLYPQSSDDLSMPIIWRVLQREGQELLLLSERILECKPYHETLIEVMWVDCDLRKWLNEEFYTEAFNHEEKLRIKKTLCTGNGDQSPDTWDQVFLLSESEARVLTHKDKECISRMAMGTDYAKMKKKDGCHLYVYDKTDERNYLFENGGRFGCSWWWLRTRGNKCTRAFFVGPRSSIRSYGEVTLTRDGVRPTLKIIVD